MSKKITIIVLVVVLAGASFGISMFVSKLFSKAPVKAAPVAAANPEGGATAQSGLPTAESPTAAALAPKEKQLDDLIRKQRAKYDELGRKESLLEQREKRLVIAQDLLKQQAQDLETLRVAMAAPMANLKKLQDELQASRVEIQKLEAVNLKKTAGIYEKMDAATSGNILASMCKNNQEMDVVKLLHYMSDRSAAKVLAEFPDKTVVGRLTEKLKMIKEET